MPTPYLLRPAGRSRRRLGALLAIPALVAPMLLTAGTGPASANPTNAGPAVAPVFLPDGAEPVPVTLITGDTVLWSDTGAGNPRVVEIEPAERDYPVDFDQSGTQEDFYVIPADAMQHVVAGTVDMELFNVPGLIRQGLDDAAAGGELPVIVTFDQDRTPQQLEQDANALPAASDAQAVEKVNGAGVKVNRGNAGKFRDAVFGEPGKGHGSSSSTPSLDGQVKRILLDQVLEIDLDASVPQIGAPQAWEAGYTGEGITVAVLDTGIDTGHPDLAGQVIAEQNFTDEPDASDSHGHGTHVASTVAGTGAASNGQFSGVAPDADLVSGKVCNSNGQCQTSWIMAGMQWATVQQGADVVNMSLGGGPTDGTDPLSQAINDLSAQTGALFVTSAGNSGPGRQRVGSPGAADAALAVGAVDKSDQMANFSSRGPRIGDHAVKPEITAPGVGIIAARAAGTGIGDPVDEHHTTLNGTSMASPHVAGAAALLAQAQGLAGQQLKDALVSTATDGGHRWYEQGTGRVNVPAAVDSPVYAQGTVNLGGVDGHAEQDITYTNHSDADITLTLEAAVTDHTGEPVDGLALSTETLTVPSGGQASATITVTADLTGQEHAQAVFGGVVTATAADVDLRTAVGFGPPLHRVDIEVLDSTGQRIGSPTAPDGLVWLVHDTFDPDVGGTIVQDLRTSGGTLTAHLPAGVYTVMTGVVETEPDAGFLPPPRRESLVVEVEVNIDTDTSLTLDARKAVPIKVSVPRKVEKRNHHPGIVRELTGSLGWFTLTVGGARNPTYATPAPAGQLAALSLVASWTLAEPQPQQPVFGSSLCPDFPFWCFSETPAYIYNLLFIHENGIPQDLHENVTRDDLVAVPTRFHADHPDTLIEQQFDALLPNTAVAAGSSVRLWFKPGKVTEYFSADDRISWHRRADNVRRPEGQGTFRAQQVSSDWFPAAEAGARRGEERWFEAPWRMGAVDNREEYIGNPRQLWFAAASRGGTDNHLFIPGFYAMDNTRGHMAIALGHASWRMWNLDTGAELEPISGLLFPLEDGENGYRLEQVEEFSARVAGVFRTGRATTTWDFTSKPSNAQVPHGYSCPLHQPPVQDVCQMQPLIQLEYDLGLDIGNRAAAGKAHTFTITAGHHSKAVDRATVTTLSVQASFDDGETWTNARVVSGPRDTFDTGGLLPSAEPYQEFRAELLIPKLADTTGFVTLRVRAADANGGIVEQTIDRAYILK